MSEQFTRGDVVSLLLEVMDWTYVKAHRETPMSEAEKKVLDEVRAALAEPEKERAEVAAPARGVGTGQTNAPTGEAYRTPEPDAIARAVEAAVKECVTICERQREKILKNPADPSWTEHLAEVQSAMKQRFSVEMGYPIPPEPEHIHTCPPDCQKPLCVNRRREIEAAVEAEREACARVCDEEDGDTPDWETDCVWSQAARHCAKAIRARGSK